jgi:Flp pilus assembly pilin Flp
MQSPTAVEVLKRIASTKRVLKKIADTKLHERSEGQDLLEYALLCSLIALVAMGAVGFVGQTIYDVFWQSIAQNF